MRFIKILRVILSFFINYSLIFTQESGLVTEKINELHYQATIFQQKQAYVRAIESYTKIIELDPGNVDAYRYRANLYGNLEKYDLAISDYRKVTVLAPNFSEAFGNLGWYLILQQRLEEAKAPLLRANAMEPHLYAWPVNLGHIFLLSGDQVTARKYYEKALTLLNSEEDFETGPIADFKLFIRNGWNPKACLKEMLWMQSTFSSENFALKPEIVIQTGHLTTIYSISFSPDGKYMITASEDMTAKLWQVSTGRAIRTFFKVGTEVSYSPNGKYIAIIGGESHNAELWQVSTGRKIRTFRGHSRYITSLSFSPDGRYLATGSSDKTAKLWDIQIADPVYTFEGHVYDINSIAFSPDGNYLATASKADKTIKLWNLKTGQMHRTFDWQPNSLYSGPILFTPDGKYIIATSDNRAIKFRDVATGAIKNFYNGYVGDVATISRDGKYLFTAGSFANARLWDLAEGTVKVFDVDSSITAAAFSPDNKYVVTGTRHAEAYLWDLKTGQKIRVFKGGNTSYGGRAVKFTSDGNHLLMGHSDGTTKLWDLTILRQKQSFNGFSSGTSANGKYLATRSANDTVKLWDVNAGQKIQTLKPECDWVNPVAISFDGSCLAIQCSDSKTIEVKKEAGVIQPIWEYMATIWDAKTGQKTQTLKWLNEYPKTVLTSWNWGAFYFETVKFSPDKNSIVTGHPSQNAIIWDVKSGREIIKCSGHRGEITEVCFSPDGKWLATASWDNSAKLWNVATGKEKHTLSGHSGRVYSVSFSPDGRYIATGSEDGTAKVWDTEDGLLIRSFEGHVGDVFSVNFSPNSKYLVTCSADATYKLWEVSTGEELATWYYFDANSWVVATPDNYYMASKGGLRDIWFRLGIEAFPFEQFDLSLNRPDIVLKRIGLASKELVESHYRAYQKRLAKLNFTEEMLSNDFHLPEISIISETVPLVAEKKTLRFKIKAQDSKYLLDRLNVFVNDVPIYGLGGIDLRTRRVATIESEIEIELGHGRNKVQVSVLNEKGAESLKETVEINYNGASSKPDLYLVAIGISRYQDKRFNLKYAAKDAKDLINTLKNQQDRYAQIHKIEILDARVTRENIATVKDSLMKSNVDDAVILFISGHGLLDANLDYYFATADIDFSNPTARGLPYEAIEGLLDGIPARKKLLLMDTCHSGEVDKEDTQQDTASQDGSKNLMIKAFRTVVPISKSRKLGLRNSFQLMQELFANLSRGSGAVVISAAAGVEFALEDEAWQNGVFTYSLLEGLKTSNADANGDGEIRVSELKDYVTKKVPALTQGQQTPTSRQENLEFDFRVY